MSNKFLQPDKLNEKIEQGWGIIAQGLLATKLNGRKDFW